MLMRDLMVEVGREERARRGSRRILRGGCNLISFRWDLGVILGERVGFGLHVALALVLYWLFVRA